MATTASGLLPAGNGRLPPSGHERNRFGIRYVESVRIGRDVIRSGDDALDYDRKVIRHVYLGEPLDIDTLPAFCTDGHRGCAPFN